jgi:hypothetical protein
MVSAVAHAAWSAERCAKLLAKAKPSPTGWKACCPAHDDKEPSLFLADGEDGSVALVCYAGCDYHNVVEKLIDLGAVLGKSRNGADIPTEHFHLGAYHSHWDYHSALGRILLRVCRWEQPAGAKDIRPLVKTPDGWRWAHHPTPRPLFQLDRLTNEPEKRGILVEGEKTAVAAQKLFPDCIASTWPGGAASTGQVDLSVLKGREVILVPDCDAAGRKAMAWMMKSLKGLAYSTRVIDPADFLTQLPEGWDLADALAEARDVSKWLEPAIGPEARGFKRSPLRWGELLGREPAPRPWRVNHWLSLGTTLFAGRGGIGKTHVAQTLATALALGRNYLDLVSAPVKVLFWACEDDHDELWRRELAICTLFGASLADLEGKLIIEPRLGLDNTLFYAEYGAPKWTALYDELVAQVNDYRVDVTFLDNIGQTFGGKENDRHHVTAFTNGLTGLAASRPHSTVALAHPGKQEESEFSGSTAWENSVRMRWYMGMKLPDAKPEDEAEGDPNVRYIAKRKTNYTVKDYRKLVFQNGVFAPELAPGIMAEFSAEQRGESAAKCILGALDRFAETSIRVTDGKNSPDYLPRKMGEMKLAQGFSPKELTDAMHQLRLGQRIIEAPIGHYENRHRKIGLVRVISGAQSEL